MGSEMCIRDRYYFNPFSGVGVNLINNDKLRLGGGVGLAFGRDGDDVPLLGDSGDIDPTLTARLSGRAIVGYAAIGIGAAVPLGGDIDGASFSASIGTRYPVSDRLTVVPGIRATYMTKGWANTFYGITQEQAAQNGLSPFLPGAGVSALDGYGIIFYEVREDLQVLAGINYSQLFGDVKDSPLTPKDSGVSAGIGFAKRF